jgi:predicted anti-sigma-YlaC factor YlaD
MMDDLKTGECGFEEQDLLLFHYREMLPNRMAEMQDHLAACSRCRESLDQITGTLALLAAEPVEFSQAETRKFTSRIMDEVHRQDRWIPSRVRMGVLAGAMVVVIMGGIFYQRGSVERSIPVTSAPLTVVEAMDERIEFLQALDILEEFEIIVELLSLG